MLLSSLSHDPLPLDFVDQSLTNPKNDQVQGRHSSQVEEHEGEYSFKLSSFSQNPLC